MRLRDAFLLSPVLLAEGSIYERLRRDPALRLDPFIAHAALLYDGAGRRALAAAHRDYGEIAVRHGLPLVAFTDTWRASAPRIASSRFRGEAVNRDHVLFLRGVLRDVPAVVGSITGPHGDGYRPAEAPGCDEAKRIHEPQIDELAEAGADLLMAATLPAFEEARGIAALMGESGIDWMLSFVIRPDGRLLDGTPLAVAIESIDAESASAPVGYSVNCVHPSVLASALPSLPPQARSRLLSFQANTSRRPPEELDGLEALETEDPGLFADRLAAVGATAALRIVGGCCGAGPEQMEALAARLDPAIRCTRH